MSRRSLSARWSVARQALSSPRCWVAQRPALAMKSRARRARELRSGEALTDHLLALRPQRLGRLVIERMGAPAGEGEAGRVDDFGDVTILAIAAADRVSLRDR